MASVAAGRADWGLGGALGCPEHPTSTATAQREAHAKTKRLGCRKDTQPQGRQPGVLALTFYLCHLSDISCPPRAKPLPGHPCRPGQGFLPHQTQCQPSPCPREKPRASQTLSPAVLCPPCAPVTGLYLQHQTLPLAVPQAVTIPVPRRASMAPRHPTTISPTAVPSATVPSTVRGSLSSFSVPWIRRLGFLSPLQPFVTAVTGHESCCDQGWPGLQRAACSRCSAMLLASWFSSCSLPSLSFPICWEPGHSCAGPGPVGTMGSTALVLSRTLAATRPRH
jgi:hypothetical protein